MPPKIRLATVVDLDAMAAMKDAAWRETYAGRLPQQVLDGLDARRPAVVDAWGRAMLDGAHFWLAEDDGEVVGLAHAAPRRDDDIDVLLELTMIYLLRRVQGIGLGRALLKTAIGDADAYLWVLDGNEPATTFYLRQGFVPDGTARTVEGMPGEVREVRMVRRTPDDD